MATVGRRWNPVAAGALAMALVVGGCGGSDESTDGGSDEPVTATDDARALFEQIGPDDPFCTAAVRRGDEVVFAAAFGADDDGTVTTDTEVDIASVSKQFTGVAIELLIADGDLSGSDLVGDLVPASRPATDDLTVDELLTHTSGLADYTELLPQELDEPATQAEAVAAIAASSPTGRRGSFEYSNSNYILLAEVVAAVTGEPLADFLADEVFDPLGLDMVLEPRGPWRQVGDGSIWTTPTDLVAWSGELWDQTLDGPDLRTVLFDPEVDTGEGEEGAVEWYGSGIMRTETDDGAELIFHDGSWDGYETDWVTIPDERLAAAVTCDEEAPLPTETIALDLLELWRPSPPPSGAVRAGAGPWGPAPASVGLRGFEPPTP